MEKYNKEESLKYLVKNRTDCDEWSVSKEDNYKEKYYHKDNEGNPICINCGSGKSGNIERNILIFVMAIVVILIILASCLN